MRNVRTIVFSGLLFLAAIQLVANTAIVKTKVVITVIDDIGNFQEGAKVTIYATLEDFNENKNPIAGGQKKTNAKGRVSFVDVPAGKLYVSAEKGKKNNLLGGEIIEGIKPNKVNKANVIISE